MDPKNHEYLQDDLVDDVEVDYEGIEEERGHNPTTAPHDAVKAVDAGGEKTKKQPLRKGDKQNADPMPKVSAKVREVIMAKEGVEFEDLTYDQLEEFIVSEEFDQLDELSKKTLSSYVSKAADSMEWDSPLVASGSRAKKRKAGIAKAKDRMTKEDVEGAFDEDLTALVESEATLSESFKEKAEVIFEAALTSKLNEHIERLDEEYENQLVEEVASIREGLVEKVDGYLNYVVETWMEENKLAIENGLRAEIAESFMHALQGVFNEHYIEVPESKIDLVDGLADKVDSLEEQLNKAVEDNIELVEAVKEYARDSVIREAAKDLSEAQGEKLKSLVEDISFDSEESFEQKVATVKESYFKRTIRSAFGEEEMLDEETQTSEISPMMEQYVAAIKKSQ